MRIHVFDTPTLFIDDDISSCWRQLFFESNDKLSMEVIKLYENNSTAKIRRIITYKLAKYLRKKLTVLIEGSKYSINCAGDAIGRFKSILIDDDELMVSFDVVSLFTSIDLNTAKETILHLLTSKPPDNLFMSPNSIQELLELCLKTLSLIHI